MTDLPADPVPDPPDLEPGSLASAEFGRARKGFEPAEVRALLGRAADALRAWKERDDRLATRVAELERRLDESRELDEERITTVLGEETARIVTAAREAAQEIRSKAEEQAARLIQESEESAAASATALTDEATALRDEAERLHAEAVAAADATRSEAQDHADRLRAEASAEHDSLLAAAKTVLGERTAEAEAAAAGIREAAQIELDAAHTDGLRLREEAREAAAAEVDRARAEGRAMVDEARQLRRQMLQDLAERRRTARRQIEAARAGRDRIVESLGAAGDRVAEVISELSNVDDQAQRAADGAAASVDDDIDSVVAELETGLTFGGLGARGLSDDPVGDDPAGHDDPAGLDASDRTNDVFDGEELDDLDQGAGPEPDRDPSSMIAAAPEVGESSTADEPSPGATVHDLFERIRAERRSDADGGHPSLDDRASDGIDLDDGELDLDELDLDDLEDDDLADDDGDGDGSDAELASVVVLEQPDDAPAEAAATDLGSSSETVIETTVIETTVIETTVIEATVIEATSIDATAIDSSSIDSTAVEADGGGVVVIEADAEEVEVEVEVAVVASAISALDRRDEMLGPVEKSLARSLKRLVSDEQNEVLDRLRRIKRGRPELSALLPDGEDLATFTTALRKDYGAAAAAGARFWSVEDGAEADGAADLVDPEVVDGGLEVRVAELLGLRRAHIQRALEHAEGSGADLTELGDIVRAAYREWRTRSVPDLAGDLAASGFALGEQAAAGDGATWCWLVDNGGLPCSDAEDNALAGAIGTGTAFPTGDLIPPAHSGCRCILVPPAR